VRAETRARAAAWSCGRERGLILDVGKRVWGGLRPGTYANAKGS